MSKCKKQICVPLLEMFQFPLIKQYQYIFTKSEAFKRTPLFTTIKNQIAFELKLRIPDDCAPYNTISEYF